MPLMVANAMGSGWIFPGLHAGRQAHRAEERVAERDLRRNRPSELTTVDEAEKSEHRAGERPESRLLEPAVDDERGEGAEHEPREHRAAAEKLHAVIDEPGARELCRAHLSGRGAGRIERAVRSEARAPSTSPASTAPPPRSSMP